MAPGRATVRRWGYAADQAGARLLGAYLMVVAARLLERWLAVW